MNSTHFHSFVLLFLTIISGDIRCKSSSDWYADRLAKTKDKNVLTIVNGPGKGRPITVTNCGITSVNRRIVGGMVAKVGQFPWSVLLFSSGKPFCGGTILNERWILTAAHCFRARKSLKLLSIKVGMVNSKKGTAYQVAKVILHDKFNSDDMQVSDLALLKTAQPIQMETDKAKRTINGICLPAKFKEPKAKTLTVSGWGRTSEDDDPSQDLRLVSLDLIDMKKCQNRFRVPMAGYPKGYTIYKTQLCTHTKNKDACKGDSGGPAIQTINGKAYLVGVVSFGVGCATDFPGVHTKVSHYLDWIAQTVD